MKKLSRITAVILAVVMLFGVMMIAPFSAGAATSAWKTAYIELINKYKSNINDGGWGWIKDLDGNGIPELFLFINRALGATQVISYNNGSLDTISASAYGTVLVQNNMFLLSYGSMGYYGDKVYRHSGTSKVVFSGSRNAKIFDFDFDNPNDFTYKYSLNGSAKKQATYSQYTSALNSVFNKSKAGALNHNNCYRKASQIISAINNYRNQMAVPTVSLSNNSQGVYAGWNKIANAEKYTVFYKSASESGWNYFTTHNNYVQLSWLTPGKLYYVQVQPVAASGDKGVFSKVKSLTYIPQTNITSLTYNGNNTLKWNAVGGANKYQIARLKSGDKAYTYFTTTKNSFTESAVGGVAYTYQVRAMYATANSGTAYGAWSSAKSVATLVAPTVTLSNQANAVMVKWNAIKGTKKYIVYFKSANQSSWKTATTTNTSLPISGVVSGTNYYVQVRPIGSTVNGPFSAPKNIIHITTIKPTLKLSNKSNGIRAEWNAFRDAKSYTVYYKSASASNWSSVTTANTYYPLLNLRSGTRYYVQVQPNFGSYKGAYSAVNSLVYQPVSQATKPVTTSYVLNTNSRVFHRSDCASVSRMNAANKSFFNGTRQQAINMGYTPCQNCNP